MRSARSVELNFGGWGQDGLDWGSHAPWLLVGPDSAPEEANVENALVGAFVDRGWVAVQPLFEALDKSQYALDGRRLCMATAIAFENGPVLVTYVRGPKETFECGGPGIVARALFDRADAQSGSEEILVEDAGCRPHTVRVGDRLVTTCDQQAADRESLTGHVRVGTISLG